MSVLPNLVVRSSIVLIIHFVPNLLQQSIVGAQPSGRKNTQDRSPGGPGSYELWQKVLPVAIYREQYVLIVTELSA